MRVKTVPSGWLRRDSKRLDCGPYTSGALEAKVHLEGLAARKDALNELTAGHHGGLYNGPQFSRTWVDGPEHGVPFVGSGAMLQADLSTLPYLRRKDATSSRLAYLRLAPQMTLISCSGTIGRMVYARPDMDGIWSSQHIMKVVPDPEKVPPGYLYAYLSSKFGVPLVVSGTYGSIIQSIEPEHIADLPVPRLGDAVEKRAHELVEEAARKRTEAAEVLSSAIAKLKSEVSAASLERAASATPYSVTVASSRSLQPRFDAFFYSAYHNEATAALRESGSPLIPLATLAKSIVEPNRFKRVPIDDPEYGVPFFGTSALMWCAPEPSYLLPRRQKGMAQYIVDESTLLVPRSGQLSGIIGTAVMPYGRLIGGAVTEDAIRIRCHSVEEAGYLLIALKWEHGLRQLKSRAFGSSIPHLDVHQIGEVLVPTLDEEKRLAIGRLGLTANRLRHEAILHEDEARTLVERTIEEPA
jgi:type I restriction enzyme, S subunit